MKELTVENTDFNYIEIESLPDYWKVKIEGSDWRLRITYPKCPYDGGALIEEPQPIVHFRCPKCGRNYA